MRGGPGSILEPASDSASTRVKVPELSEDSAPTTTRDRAWPAGRAIRVGDMIGGRYRVERLLGAGGMGQVVEALHVELERVVAVKVLHEEWAKDEDSARRFVREARVVATLSNEHVVRIFDLGRTPEGAPFIVMERLEGQDLGAVLEARGAVTILEATEWVAQASEALSEAHGRGIVHRDVKPQNLFLAKLPNRTAPVLKVLDFGLAKNILPTPGEESRLTGVHMLLGSPHFMSPEQIRDARGVDSRTDVWSLGATLFQLLTREPPFVAKNLHMLCAGILTAPIPSVRSVRPDVPEALDHIVQRCLSRSLDERYPSAKELALELRAFLATIDVLPRDRSTAPLAPAVLGARPRSMVHDTAPTEIAYVEETKLLEPVVDPPALATPQAFPMAAPSSPALPNAEPRLPIPVLVAGTVIALVVAIGIFAYKYVDRRPTSIPTTPTVSATTVSATTASAATASATTASATTGLPTPTSVATPASATKPEPPRPEPTPKADVRPHPVPRPHPSTRPSAAPQKPAPCTDAYACP